MKTKGGGKAKGASFERFVCRRLSLWVSKGEREDLFWRSAMSGGRATLQLKRDVINLTQSGDMTAIAPEGFALCQQCLFEYKSYRDLDIDSSLLRSRGRLRHFWFDTVKAAEKYGKVPVLVAKQNLFPVLLVCPRDCQVFTAGKMLDVIQWDATVYIFEEATRVRLPRVKIKRLASHG